MKGRVELCGVLSHLKFCCADDEWHCCWEVPYVGGCQLWRRNSDAPELIDILTVKVCLTEGNAWCVKERRGWEPVTLAEEMAIELY